MRIASAGHAVFAATMIVLGVLGLVQGQFTPVWNPVPKGAPARETLVFLCAFLSLASGMGLLWQRTAVAAARTLLAALLLWWLLFRVPFALMKPGLGTFFPVCELAVVMSAAWVLYHCFATEWDRQRLGFASGPIGLRIARMLFGVSLIFFGLAHFLDVKDTVSLVPGWLPWHHFWAYFFGCAFIAAGLAVLIGVFARLAAVLATLEIGMFTLLVWVPIVAAGSANAFDWSEMVLSCVLTAAGWVVADSYQSRRWLAARAFSLKV